ncbi:hypothetical protein TKK_0005908 [Trichogramma kaykai]
MKTCKATNGMNNLELFVRNLSHGRINKKGTFSSYYVDKRNVSNALLIMKFKELSIFVGVNDEFAREKSKMTTNINVVVVFIVVALCRDENSD